MSRHLSEIAHQWCIQEGLYTNLLADEQNTSNVHHLILKLLQEEYGITAYCVDCEQETTFNNKPLKQPVSNRVFIPKAKEESIPMMTYDIAMLASNLHKYNDTRLSPKIRDNAVSLTEMYSPDAADLRKANCFDLIYTCGICGVEYWFYFIMSLDTQLFKAGQFPSYADIHGNDLRSFKLGLTKEMMSEYQKSVGLYAHDIGAGAIIYLRRIIERIIEEATNNLTEVDKGNLTESRFVDRMKEIEKLRPGSIPKPLLENAIIYGVLSDGIHNKTEREIRKLYPACRAIIEFIVKERHRERQAERDLQNMSQELSQLNPGHEAANGADD